MNKILKLEPIIKNYIWGGERLSKDFRYKSKESPIAEVWLLSGHPVDSNKITGLNMTLAEYVTRHGRDFLGASSPMDDQLPILIKLIDAKNALSVQVHPDDKYAQSIGQPFGKTEMWYILDTDKDNTIVYGTKTPITKDELIQVIYEERLEDVLNKEPIEKGDSIFIEAGTIHAINAGTLVFEVQQSSNTTYRLYDYNRTDKDGNKRELHVEESLDVSNLIPLNANFSTRSQKLGSNELVELQNNDLFKVERYDIEKEIDIELSGKSFVSVVIIEGSGLITVDDESFTFEKGDSFVMPAQQEICNIAGHSEIIISQV